jgi:hypothetical protein
LQKDH